MARADETPRTPPVVRDRGSGRPILLLHGFPLDSRSFDRLEHLLLREGFRVITFDQHGFDDPFCPLGPRKRYSPSRLADDAAAVLSRLKVGGAVVVGHDLGGLVALELARRHPQITSASLLVSMAHPLATTIAMLNPRQLAGSAYVLLAQSSLVITALYSPHRSASRRRLERRLLKSGLPKDAVASSLDRMAIGCAFHHAVRWYQGLPFASLRSLCPRRSGRYALLWGQDDSVLGRAAMRMSLAMLPPGTMLQEVRYGSHWLPLDRPEAIVDAVRSVSQSVSESSL